MSATPKPRPAALTEAEKKAQAIKFIAQKRESFAINILCSLCQSGIASSNDTFVDAAVKMADKLIETLYPLPED